MTAFDFETHDRDAAVSYHPWTDGRAIGFEVHTPRGIEFIYLNPSTGSDDGVPTVFLYQGVDGDPNADSAVHHYIVGEGVVEYRAAIERWTERRRCPACGTLVDEDGYCVDVGCPNCGKSVAPYEVKSCKACGEDCVRDDPRDDESWIHAPWANDLADHTAEVDAGNDED